MNISQKQIYRFQQNLALNFVKRLTLRSKVKDTKI